MTNRMYEVRWIEGLPVDPGLYLLYKRDIGTVYHAPADHMFNSAPITKENHDE